MPWRVPLVETSRHTEPLAGQPLAVEQARGVARAAVAQHGDDGVSRSEPFGHLQCRRHVDARGAAEKEPFLVEQPIDGGDRLLVIDLQETFVSVNDAACRMFGVRAASAVGQAVEQVVRNTALQQFIRKALRSDVTMQNDFVQHMHYAEATVRRDLEVQSAPLLDEDGRRRGVIIVVHDVSELHRLEGVRREFVANVSHEIKTPVTAIKGFCETLLDGGDHDPADARRFLEIIGRQAERLHAIVEDVLTLSRLETEQQERRVELRAAKIAPMLHAAGESCAIIAEAKRIRINVVCPADLSATINAPMLEQAVVNLLDNAIKFSPPDSEVVLEAAHRPASDNGAAGRELMIRVIDHGTGIERVHLPRLFERFYRTDKARSREQGGTGLGLAIVKHIATAHGGWVSVESEPERGSVFGLHLPDELVVAPPPAQAQRAS